MVHLFLLFYSAFFLFHSPYGDFSWNKGLVL